MKEFNKNIKKEKMENTEEMEDRSKSAIFTKQKPKNKTG